MASLSFVAFGHGRAGTAGGLSAAKPRRGCLAHAEGALSGGFSRVPIAMPNVRVEAGPTVLCLAREAHHVPRCLAGQAQCRWASPRPRG